MRKKFFRKYFVPHEENDFLPYLLREAEVLGLLFLILAFFSFAALWAAVGSRADFYAAIVPSVLTDFANQEREHQGLVPLARSALLEEAARRKAADMAEQGYFSHNAPDGKTPWQWLTEAGYLFQYAGENLAIDFADSEKVHEAWLRSPTHRANILGAYFTEIGIAAVKGSYQGRETLFVVQMFGRPLAVVRPGELTELTEKVSVVSEGPAAVPTVVPEIATIYADDSFVAAKNVSGQVAAAEVSLVGTAPHSTTLEKFLVSPGKILAALYSMLGLMIMVAILLNIFIEIRRQHPRHILYGVSLLVLMVFLSNAVGQLLTRHIRVI